MTQVIDTVLEKQEFSALKLLFARHKARSQALRQEPLSARLRRISKLKAWLMDHRGELQKAVFEDFHKPALEVETSEFFPVVGEINLALDNLTTWSKSRKVDAPLTYLGTRAEIRYEPKGVCLIVSPWNYPFNLCIGPLVSCLAAGNTAIIKPSEMTPHTSAFIRKLVSSIFDRDVVEVVEGDASVATELLKLPFDHIFFTGSPAVGKIVMRAAAEHLSSVTLELGGKSPAIVDATADLKDTAKRIAFGKFLNNGQTCIAPDYVLIAGSVKEKFIEYLKTSVEALFGNGKMIGEESPDYARVINGYHFDRLSRLVKDAVQKGARPVLTGESNRGSLFFPPTILTDVPEDALLMEEEIFGPILPIMEMTSNEDAIMLVNTKPKPLALYVFSNDRGFREKILKETSAGAVCINDCVIQFTHPNVPFGGVNNSGMGKAHGQFGFMSFSNEKPVIRQRKGLANAYLFYPPYTKVKGKLLEFVLRWIL